jgi:3-oxoacyl-[acyl-carrier protein] reductase
MELKGKKALVCGATQGIGKAIALKLANMGASVILIARNEEKLIATKNELTTANHQLHDIISLDFSDYKSVEEFLTTWRVNQKVDILVNNTGGPKGGPMLEASITEFIETFNQHLICNHLFVQAVVPGMKQLGGGKIINIISTSVKQPLPGLGVSNTIRGAVGNWSKTLANELGQFNITVNNVLPGATNTIRLQQIAEVKSAKTGDSIPDIFSEMALESPMKRIAEPEEVANVVAFLASDAASYVNGINIPVDGGRTKSL